MLTRIELAKQFGGKPLSDYDLLRDYLINGLTGKEIAGKFELPFGVIAVWARENGINMDNKGLCKIGQRSLAKGYDSISEFFQQNWKLSSRDRVNMLGCSERNLNRLYDLFIQVVEVDSVVN